MAESRRFKRAPTDQPIEDLTGQRFGFLTALRPYSQRAANGKLCWICRCRCGTEVAYPAVELKRRSVSTCGSPGCRYRKKK